VWVLGKTNDTQLSNHPNLLNQQPQHEVLFPEMRLYTLDLLLHLRE
jgi:hypothetical protein